MLQILVDAVKPSFAWTTGWIGAWCSKGFNFPGPAVDIHALEVPKPSQPVPAEDTFDTGEPESRSKIIKRISIGEFG